MALPRGIGDGVHSGAGSGALTACGGSSAPAVTGQARLWLTGCEYANAIPAPDNGYNGGPGTWTVTVTNRTRDPITLHTLNMQFSSFSTKKTLASQTVRPAVTLAGDASRKLSFAAPEALHDLEENDTQAYGNADGSDVDCSQNGWS